MAGGKGLIQKVKIKDMGYLCKDQIGVLVGSFRANGEQWFHVRYKSKPLQKETIGMFPKRNLEFLTDE
jgi:hypothetical protein